MSSVLVCEDKNMSVEDNKRWIAESSMLCSSSTLSMHTVLDLLMFSVSYRPNKLDLTSYLGTSVSGVALSQC